MALVLVLTVTVMEMEIVCDAGGGCLPQCWSLSWSLFAVLEVIYRLPYWSLGGCLQYHTFDIDDAFNHFVYVLAGFF